MKLEGTYTIAAPLDAVWRNLMDPAVLQRAMPGCQKLEEKAPNQYRAVLKAGVGPVKGTFHGDINIADIVPEKSVPPEEIPDRSLVGVTPATRQHRQIAV